MLSVTGLTQIASVPITIRKIKVWLTLIVARARNALTQLRGVAWIDDFRGFLIAIRLRIRTRWTHRVGVLTIRYNTRRIARVRYIGDRIPIGTARVGVLTAANSKR